jgi:putative flippase GtrA
MRSQRHSLVCKSMEKAPRSKKKQFIQFALVGGIATFTQYVFLFIALQIVDVGIAIIAGISYLAGSLVAYALNYNFTFSSDEAHHRVLPKFYAMVFAGWLLTAMMMKIFVDHFGFNTWVSQITTTCLVLAWNFLLSRTYVFKEKP